MEINTRTFILGVGAQKAGTTWLKDYLNQREEIFMHPLKEVHFFDSLYQKKLFGYFNNKFSKMLIDMTKNISFNNILKNKKYEALMYRVLMSKDETLYVKYYENNILEQHIYYGEITPSYSLLSEEDFKKIKKKFSKIKIIFLMRDPVDRHLSSFKMKLKLKNSISNNFDQDFIESLNDPTLYERGNYSKIITTLEKVFDKDEIYYGFYENLFSDYELKKLCYFLDIKFIAGGYNKYLNKSTSTQSITAETLKIAENHYSEIYDFCFNKFSNQIPNEWKNNIH